MLKTFTDVFMTKGICVTKNSASAKENSLWSALCLAVATGIFMAHFPVVGSLCILAIGLGLILRLSWLTWLVIALAPLQFVAIPQAYVPYKISYFDILVLLLLISFTRNRAVRGLSPSDRKLLSILGVYCLVGLVSLVGAITPFEGVSYLLRLMAVIVVFISVLRFVRQYPFRVSCSAVLVCVWIVIVMAAVRGLHAVENLDTTLRLLLQDPGSLERLGSIYDQPNVTGQTLAVFLPALVGFAFLPGGRRTTWFALIATAIIAAGLVILTGSRAAMITAAIGLAMLAFCLGRFPLLLLLVLTCSFILTLHLSYLRELFFEVRRLSLEGRIDLAYYGLKIAWQYPLVGVGLRHFGFHLYDVPSYLVGRSSHNLYLEVLVETGILGFGVFSMFIIQLFRRLMRVRYGEERFGKFVRGIALSSLVTLLVSKLFAGGLLLVTWWVVLGFNLGFADRGNDSASAVSENNGSGDDEGSRSCG